MCWKPVAGWRLETRSCGLLHAGFDGVAMRMRMEWRLYVVGMVGGEWACED